METGQPGELGEDARVIAKRQELCRSCSDPAPANGGAGCSGSNTKDTGCNGGYCGKLSMCFVLLIIETLF